MLNGQILELEDILGRLLPENRSAVVGSKLDHIQSGSSAFDIKLSWARFSTFSCTLQNYGSHLHALKTDSVIIRGSLVRMSSGGVAGYAPAEPDELQDREAASVSRFATRRRSHPEHPTHSLYHRETHRLGGINVPRRPWLARRVRRESLAANWSLERDVTGVRSWGHLARFRLQQRLPQVTD